MPKIIEEARARILSTARGTLLEKGYTGLSLRGLARDCGMAVGTIYNYFQDKDTLVACIMMEDWTAALARMDAACADAACAADGLEGICRAVEAFAAVYAPVWGQFSRTGGSSGIIQSRHGLLRGQIEARIRSLMERLQMEDTALAPLLAEAVLAAALQPDIGRDQLGILAGRLR